MVELIEDIDEVPGGGTDGKTFPLREDIPADAEFEGTEGIGTEDLEPSNAPPRKTPFERRDDIWSHKWIENQKKYEKREERGGMRQKIMMHMVHRVDKRERKERKERTAYKSTRSANVFLVYKRSESLIKSLELFGNLSVFVTQVICNLS